jgi:mannose-1-phosphate guanylyltransferase
MLHAVIMAGGAGTRFWPASRTATPKQLLDLAGQRTMIQATVDRLHGLVPGERVQIITNERLVAAIQEQLPEVRATSILGEPCKRDTAPCIGLSAVLLQAVDPEATMIVMPSDHVIEPVGDFQKALAQAARLVDADPNWLVTFGIRPTYPAESFGYIERGESFGIQAGETPAFRVSQFKEKPKLATAREYLATGRFYWNAGIFVWKARTVLAGLERHEPMMFAHLQRIADAVGKPSFKEVLREEFTAIKPRSIDYAIMEKAEQVAVLEAPFQWDDLGSWQALERLRGTDENGNTVVGRHVGIGTTKTIVRGDEQHLIVTIGVEDLIIVHTPDATLVAKKSDEEAVREAVKALEQKGWSNYL